MTLQPVDWCRTCSIHFVGFWLHLSNSSPVPLRGQSSAATPPKLWGTPPEWPKFRIQFRMGDNPQGLKHLITHPLTSDCLSFDLASTWNHSEWQYMNVESGKIQVYIYINSSAKSAFAYQDCVLKTALQRLRSVKWFTWKLCGRRPIIMLASFS